MKWMTVLAVMTLAVPPAGAVIDTVVAVPVISTQPAMQSRVALDNQNGIHILYYESSDQSLRHAKWVNGGVAWSFLSNVTTEQVAPQIDLGLRLGQTPEVVYYQTSGTPGLYHGRYNGTVWSQSTIETFDSTTPYCALALGSDGNARVAYHNSESSATALGVFDGVQWSTFTVFTSTYEAAVDIALDSDDVAHIAFVSGSTTTNELWARYAIQNGSTFTYGSPVIIGASTDPVGGISLALDDNGVGHVAVYASSFNALGYIQYSSTGAVLDARLLDGLGTGLYNDIALTSQGNPRIVYTSTGVGLSQADFDGTVWSTSTVEAGPLNGVGPSLLFNRFNHAMVSYFNADANELKFYTDAARNLSISGSVLDFGGAPIPGVNLALTGNIAATTLPIDGAGAFQAQNLVEGGYTLTPSLSGYAFQPINRVLSALTASVTGQTFQGGLLSFGQVDNLFDPTQGQQVTFNYDVIPGHVKLQVYSLRGTPVKTLVDEDLSAGTYSVTWDGRDSSGEIVASGVYLIRFEADQLRKSEKVLVVK